MSDFLEGSLFGEYGPKLTEALEGTLILVYPKELSQTMPQEYPRLLDQDELNQRLDQKAIGQAVVDKKGNYRLEISKEMYYQPFVLEARFTKVPQQAQPTSKIAQVALASFPAPAEVVIEELELDFLIIRKLWCWLKAYFDLWTISGKITNCDTGAPFAAGLRVIAKDRDWIRDDGLGSALTDGNGNFRIDYTSADFKQNFIPLNLETPFSNVVGPDIYFKVETQGGIVLLEEDRDKGLEEDRKDRGACFYAPLCIDIPFDQKGDHKQSAWTRIGEAFALPLVGMPAVANATSIINTAGHGVSANGTEFGITGRSVKLKGAVALTDHPQGKAVDGNQIEYRFLALKDQVQKTNEDAAIDPNQFNLKVGIDIPTGNFRVGTMVFNDGNPQNYHEEPIVVTPQDFNADGWLNLNNTITRIFQNAPNLNVADLTDPALQPNWRWIPDTGLLMPLDTTRLYSEDEIMHNQAGVAVPQNLRVDANQQCIGLRFEIRLKNPVTGQIVDQMRAQCRTLNALKVDNTKPLLLVEIKRQTPCQAVRNNGFSISFTAYHPYLDNTQLRVTSNDRAFNELLFNQQNQADHIANGFRIDNPFQGPNGPVPLPECTYVAVLSARPRLHTGDSQVLRSQGRLETFFLDDPNN